MADIFDQVLASSTPPPATGGDIFDQVMQQEAPMRPAPAMVQATSQYVSPDPTPAATAQQPIMVPPPPPMTPAGPLPTGPTTPTIDLTPEPATPPQPSPLEQAGAAIPGAFQQATAPMAQAANNLWQQINALPFLGDIAKLVQGGAETAGKVPGEVIKDWGTAGLAGVAGLEGGGLGLVDQIANISRLTTKNLPDEVVEGAAHAGLDPTTLPFAIESLARFVNRQYGRPDDAPVNLRDAFMQFGPVKPIVEAAPATAATGEFLAGSAAPAAVPMGSAFKGLPVLRTALEGALAGEAYGTAAGVNRQIQEGKSPDFLKAAGEALPGAALAGAIGGGAGFTGKLIRKVGERGGRLEGGVETNVAAPGVPDEIAARIDEANKISDEAQRKAALTQIYAEIEQSTLAEPTPATPRQEPLTQKWEAALEDIRQRGEAAFEEAGKLRERMSRGQPDDYRLKLKKQYDDAWRDYKTSQASAALQKNAQSNQQAAQKMGEQQAAEAQAKAADLEAYKQQAAANKPPETPEQQAAAAEADQKIAEGERQTELTLRDQQQFPLAYLPYGEKYVKVPGMFTTDPVTGNQRPMTELNPDYIPLQEYRDSDLQFDIDRHNMTLQLPSSTGPQKGAATRALKILTAEKARREFRKAQGEPPDWMQEAPGEGKPTVPPDLTTLPDDELTTLTGHISDWANQDATGARFADPDLERLEAEAARRQQAPPPEPPAPEGRPQNQPNVTENVTPQTEAPQAIEPTPPAENVQENATGYTVGPDPDPAKAKAGYKAIFRPDGTLHSSSKRSEATAQAVADKLTRGELKETQGQKPKKNEPVLPPPEMKPDTGELIGSSQEITRKLNDPAGIEAGQKLTPKQKPLFEAAATAKRILDMAEAKLKAAQRKFFNDLNVEPRQNQLTADQKLEIENQLNEAFGPADLPGFDRIEGFGIKPKLKSYDFGDATTIEARQQVLNDLAKELSDAKKAWDNSKKPLQTQFNNGDVPKHVVFGEGNERVSFENRSQPRRSNPDAQTMRADLEAQALENAPERFSTTQTLINDFAKELETADPGATTRTIEELSATNSPEQALQAALTKDKGGRFLKMLEPHGYGGPGGTTTNLAIDPAAAFAIGAAKVAKPAAKLAAKGYGKVSELLTGDKDTLNGFMLLRRSLDVIEEHSKDLHNKLWRNIGKEAVEGRGLNLDKVDEAVVNSALRDDPADVLAGSGIYSKLSTSQRRYLAQRRILRQQSAGLLRDAIEQFENAHGGQAFDKKTLSRRDLHTYEVMDFMEKELTGRQSESGTTELAVGALTRAMYDYIFKLNPSFHALNRLDPLIVGSSRAGLGRILKAQAMLVRDKQVRSFIESIQGRGVVEEFRAQERRTTKQGGFLGKIYEMSDKVPDFPTERWNINDAMAAGFINHGDRIGYKGGGTQFLKDLAAGKIHGEAQVDAFVEAMQITNDITGAGSLGIDKDILGRSKIRGIVQFISQPLRVSRLAVKYAKEDPGKLGTLLAMTYLLGGQAAIPEEAKVALKMAGRHDQLYAAENFLDDWSLLGMAGRAGLPSRDLSQKLKWSLVPIFGAETNVAFENLQSTAHNLEKGRFDKALMGGALMLALPQIFAGTGTVIRSAKLANDVRRNERDIYVPQAGYSPAGKIIGHGKRPFNIGNALLELGLPGQDREVGRAITTTQQRNEYHARFGKELPGTTPAFNGIYTRKGGSTNAIRKKESATET